MFLFLRGFQIEIFLHSENESTIEVDTAAVTNKRICTY